MHAFSTSSISAAEIQCRARAKSPNAAHEALACLSVSKFRDIISPDSTFTLITQNVDGLSGRALNDLLRQTPDQSPPEQPYMLEMHGRLFDVKCFSRSCGYVYWNDASPICPALASTETLVDAGVTEPHITEAGLPRCPKCGSLARPGVVWFGEMPYHLDEIEELVGKLISVSSSERLRRCTRLLDTPL